MLRLTPRTIRALRCNWAADGEGVRRGAPAFVQYSKDGLLRVSVRSAAGPWVRRWVMPAAICSPRLQELAPSSDHYARAFPSDEKDLLGLIKRINGDRTG